MVNVIAFNEIEVCVLFLSPQGPECTRVIVYKFARTWVVVTRSRSLKYRISLIKSLYIPASDIPSIGSAPRHDHGAISS